MNHGVAVVDGMYCRRNTCVGPLQPWASQHTVSRQRRWCCVTF